MAMASGHWRSDRTIGELGWLGAMARFGRGICCPGLVVLVLLAAALVGPLSDRDRSMVARLERPYGALVSQVAFATDGVRIYTNHKGLGPMIVEADERGLRWGRDSAEFTCTTMAVDPTGRALVVALADGRLQIRDPESLDVRQTLIGHDKRVIGLAVSTNGETLVSIDERLVRVRSLADDRYDGVLQSPTTLSSCTLSPDGRWIALGGREGSIAVIDAATGVEEARWDGHGRGGSTLDLAFTPDGRSLASVGTDHMLRTWAVAGWTPLQAIRLQGGISPCLAIAPDGRSVATGHVDGQVRIWDLTTSALIAAVPVDSVQVVSVCYAPDGRQLAVSSGSAVSVVDVIGAA